MVNLPPPPAPPPGGMVRAPRDYLAVPLGSIYVGRPAQKPLSSYAPARPPVPSGREMLHAPVPGHPIPVGFAIAERLLSALASLGNAADAARTFANSITIRQFREMTPQQQTAHIDGIWNRCTTAHPFGQATPTMFDPNNNIVAGNGPLPSSIVPGGGGFVKRLPAADTPFRTLGVGFRTEGSIDRCLRHGFTQQRLNPDFMKGPHRGLNLEGTVMNDRAQARIWTGNHDIFNESAVCVSRNFFGGTAFPTRETQGTNYLFAVDCTALLGVDTEQIQLNLPNARQWRPGEKAYPAIPVPNILGYVKFDKRGAPPGGGWRFDIAKDANWTFTGSPSVTQRTYLIDELNAWRGSHTIPPEFDFAN